MMVMIMTIISEKKIFKSFFLKEENKRKYQMGLRLVSKFGLVNWARLNVGPLTHK